MQFLRLAAFLAVAMLVLAACGGSGSPGAQVSRDQKEPKALLKDVAAALRRVRSYHLEGTQDAADGHARVSGDVARNGNVRLKMNTEGRTLEIIAAGTRLYIRANAAFWRQNGGDRLAQRLDERWVVAPAQIAASITGDLDRLRPSGLAFCAAQPTGHLENRGTAIVGGRQAIVITDKGDLPGDAPGAIYVQAHGPALLLRAVQTGPIRPGRDVDPRCDNPGSSATKGDLRFSRFDAPVTIEAPKHVLDLGQLGGGGGTV
ncbi:MAG: hypothetical protein QOH62_3316 [Solirubrobacteraceae bacterium]|nr:hypothetical protein [Solirubrobacteraceae bacterium]